MARRNLTPEQRKYLIGKQYLEQKKEHGGTGANQYKVQSGQNVHLKTSEVLSEKYKVDEKTVRRAAQYAQAIDTIKKIAPKQQSF